MAYRISVLIPAAGCGERMECTKQKQFCVVHGKPLICHTVNAFLQVQWVEKIIIVASADAKKEMTECIDQCRNCAPERIVIISGGKTRHKSILCGIDYISNAGYNPDVLVIHDGVRPLVPLQILVDVVEAAKEHGAAGVINPLISTVVCVDANHFLEQSLERTKYFASEMPQAFKFAIIQDAYKKCSEHDLDHGTECLHLVLKYTRVRAKLVRGNSYLWKVTHKKDLYCAEGMLAESEHVTIIEPALCRNSMVQPAMCKALLEKFSKVEIAQALEVLDIVWNVVYIHNESLGDVLDMLTLTNVIPTTVERIVHVILGPLENENYFRLVQKAKQISSEKKQSVIFICLQNQEIDFECCRKMGEVAASFLFNPMQAFSSQVILL